jgi:sugar (pentulose or hexulose) kinase
MALLLGIDLGTSYFKVGLFDEAGALQGLGRLAVEPRSSLPGRVELAANDFWQRLRQALAGALEAAGATVREIAAMSYSSQANTFILLDGNSRALTPLIFWTDQRARPLDARLAEFGTSVRHARVTGLASIVPECAPAKWAWFARNEPALWSRVAHALTVSDYLAYALTGERVGDASTAVLTGLYHLEAQSWWKEALATFDVNEKVLPRVLRPGTPCGRTNANATQLLGIPAGVPFAVGALDHHAAALGSGLGRFADASLSTGTVLAALVLVDRVVPSRGCIHGPHTDGRRFYRLAFDPAGAGKLEEYQREHAPHLDVSTLVGLAETPSDASAADVRHGRAIRAMLQSIVAIQKGLLQEAADGVAVHAVTATGGGSRSPFLLQMQADDLALPVLTAACPERACLGAALFAGVAAGWFPDPAAAASAMVHRAREYLPKS